MTNEFNSIMACHKLAEQSTFNIGLGFSLIAQAQENKEDHTLWTRCLESALGSLRRERERLQVEANTLASSAELAEFQTSYIIQVTAGLPHELANAVLSLWCACRFGGKPLRELENAMQWLQSVLFTENQRRSQELQESAPVKKPGADKCCGDDKCDKSSCDSTAKSGLGWEDKCEPAPVPDFPVGPDTLEKYAQYLIDHISMKGAARKLRMYHLRRWERLARRAIDAGVGFSIERYFCSAESIYRYNINCEASRIEQKLARARARRERRERKDMVQLGAQAMLPLEEQAAQPTSEPAAS